ncbi:MAG: hypothetical protein QM753_06850 [Thermomicrobiales bacterium]
MGARLASLAANPAWASLTPRARLVLQFMALRCYDRDQGDTPAGTYWGGHRELATRVYGDDTPARVREIRRYVAELIEAGAIERIENARGRGVAAYKVTPDNPPEKPPPDLR